MYSGSGTAYEVGIGHIEKFPFFIHELFGNICIVIEGKWTHLYMPRNDDTTVEG